jgi:hypothetical protein
MILSLATGIIYFTFTVVGLSMSAGLAVLIVGVPFFMSLIFAPLVGLAERLGILAAVDHVHVSPEWLDTVWALPFLFAAGVLLLTVLMHVSRGLGRLHAGYAKALLVARG